MGATRHGRDADVSTNAYLNIDTCCSPDVHTDEHTDTDANPDHNSDFNAYAYPDPNARSYRDVLAGRQGNRPLWLDRNANGAAEAGEPGVAGVLLTLAPQAPTQNSVEGIVVSTVTDTNGKFEFLGSPGDGVSWQW